MKETWNSTENVFFLKYEVADEEADDSLYVHKKSNECISLRPAH